MKKAIYVFLTMVCVVLTGIIVFADHIDTKAEDVTTHQLYYNHEETQRSIIPEDVCEKTADEAASYSSNIVRVAAMTLSQELSASTEADVKAVEENVTSPETADSEKREEPYSVIEAAAPIVRTVEIDTDPNSITVLVNHEYALSEEYVPDDLVYADVYFNCVSGDEKRMMRKEAAEELKRLFDAAAEDGLKLCAMSGYRSYERQNRLHLNNVRLYGEDYADCYSAKAGESEHQLGLAMDISSLSNNYVLDYNFSSTAEGLWLAENACEFGFIIRYPENKEEITGFAFEPWHVRYVGKKLAEYLTMNELTLDEYYGVSADTASRQD